MFDPRPQPLPTALRPSRLANYNPYPLPTHRPSKTSTTQPRSPTLKGAVHRDHDHLQSQLGPVRRHEPVMTTRQGTMRPKTPVATLRATAQRIRQKETQTEEQTDVQQPQDGANPRPSPSTLLVVAGGQHQLPRLPLPAIPPTWFTSAITDDAPYRIAQRAPIGRAQPHLRHPHLNHRIFQTAQHALPSLRTLSLVPPFPVAPPPHLAPPSLPYPLIISSPRLAVTAHGLPASVIAHVPLLRTVRSWPAIEHNGIAFTVTHKLGTGATGRVVRGIRNGRAFAIKIMHKPALSEHRFTRGDCMWEQEMMIIVRKAGCKARYLVPLLMSWEDPEKVYFVMVRVSVSVLAAMS